MTQTLDRTDTMTAEEFWTYCAGRDGRIDLVQGRVVEMPPVNPVHGRLDVRLLRLWSDYVIDRGLGEVFLNTGFTLFRNPDVVRGPDQAFVSRAPMDASPAPERGFWPVIPELVVEIVSPDDRAYDVNAMVDDYLHAGVGLIWVVYPGRQQVYVYRPGERVEIVERHGALDGGEVIPGLQVSLSQLWPPVGVR